MPCYKASLPETHCRSCRPRLLAGQEHRENDLGHDPPGGGGWQQEERVMNEQHMRRTAVKMIGTGPEAHRVLLVRPGVMQLLARSHEAMQQALSLLQSFKSWVGRAVHFNLQRIKQMTWRPANIRPFAQVHFCKYFWLKQSFGTYIYYICCYNLKQRSLSKVAITRTDPNGYLMATLRMLRAIMVRSLVTLPYT